MAGENWPQARDTPPPITYMGRLRALIRLAKAIPRAVPAAAKICWAARSPACVQVYTVRAVNAGSCFVAEAKQGDSPEPAASTAARRIAVAEAYCSRQPRLPHGHALPSAITVM